MPGWTLHLEIGDRIADKLQYKGQDREDFLFGCILPDINNGYLNNVKEKLGHEVTHFAYDKKSSLNFYEEYKDKIKARVPIYMGYLVHLYTDGYFNYDFWSKIEDSPKYEELTHEQKTDLKHKDFWLFGSQFDHRLKISDLTRACKLANEIQPVDLDEDDLRNVLKLFDEGDALMSGVGDHYIFYTEEEMEHVAEDMIESFSRDYLTDDERKIHTELGSSNETHDPVYKKEYYTGEDSIKNDEA